MCCMLSFSCLSYDNKSSYKTLICTEKRKYRLLISYWNIRQYMRSMKSTSAASVEGKLNYATSAHSTVLDSWGISWNQGGIRLAVDLSVCMWQMLCPSICVLMWRLLWCVLHQCVLWLLNVEHNPIGGSCQCSTTLLSAKESNQMHPDASDCDV